MEEEIRNLSQEDDIKKTLQELVQRAAKDDLSGLLNRSTMERFIKRRLEEMTPEERCALFIVDLDDFKLVNDTLGHQAGDAAIRQSAEILSQIFRASDIVGRLGGDEFAVFICGRISEELVREKAATICERLQLALGTSRLVNLTASVGVYLAQGQQTFESLYQSADLALYRAKKAGKHTFCLKNFEKDGFQDGHFAAFRPVNAISLVKLLEYMDDGVALLEMGEHLQIIYVSPSYCRICGEEYEGFKLPRMLEELVHPDDLPGLLAALRAGLTRGETVEYDHRAYAKAQGRELWLHIRANVVEYALENPVMLVTISDITRSRQEREELKLANRRLQAAFDQTSLGMWEVDVAQRTLRTFAADGGLVPLTGGEARFPEALVDGGWIHPDSVPRFLKFAREMLDGRTRGYGNFIIRRHLAGGYSWTALSYQVLFDEAGQAVRVVGVAEDFPRSFGDPAFWENAFQVPLPEGMLADLVARMRADLDADVVETLWHGGQNLNAKTVDWTVDELLHGYRASFYDPEDDGEFSALLDRAALLAAWREGRRWFSGEHRCADTNGSIRWIRTVLHLAENPGSGHVMLFGYVLDVEHARRLEQAPVALAREHAASLSGDRPAQVWRYTAFPLIREGEVVGFLCIENAMQHPGDLGLFTTLVPYLLQERERFRPKERTLRSVDHLMGLPDLRAYTEAIGKLTSAHYSTLGVVCLSVPNLAAINGDMGFEFGSRLLWFVAKTLSELFDGSLLFRTWEAEFVCFLPDVTQEVFQLRVSRLRAILTRRYPRQMRIGTAWAEGEFAAERLVKTAKAALGAQEEISQEMQRFVKAAEGGLGEGETLSEERFTVYYQPKIDLTTGELVGAEALVRGIGEDGSLIAPAQFITYMEEDGSIRALDLFVLEQALAQMAAWQEKGLGLVPVSVNLSRVTMVSPTTPASILALQSHYPTIPPEALEIEITERGPMETETFQDAVEKYSACGLRLSLDDFGSQYANLSLFTNVRFDTVKLDRSLIARLGDNPVNEALVRDIIAICRTYGMNCVAEGVETEEHAALLRSLGCRFAQGYYYDKPLAAADFEEKYLWRRTLKFSDHTGKETHS